MEGMMTPFSSVLAVPMWQGAGEPHGYMRGCRYLAWLVRQSRVVKEVSIDSESFSAPQQGVKALDTLQVQFRRMESIIKEMEPPMMTLGGDCAADFVPIAQN